MPTTYTASDQLAQPRAVESGANLALGRYQSTVTLSVSDLIFIAKVPHGATVYDGYIAGTIDSAGSTVKLGIIGAAGALSDANLLSATTLSATAVLARFNATGLPIKVSLSDDATQRFAWLTLTVVTAASLTQSSSITVVVEYAMPGAI